MLQKKKLGHEQVMACRWSPLLRDRPKIHSHNPEPAASIPMLHHTPLARRKLRSAYLCAHTSQVHAKQQRSRDQTGQSRTWQSRALRICLPAATKPCRTPGHLWLHLAWRAETHMCSFGKGLSKYFDVLFNPTEGRLHSERKRQVTICCYTGQAGPSPRANLLECLSHSPLPLVSINQSY